MAVFPFTVRATDSEGSYADRQFNITVRNSRVERFMVLTATDAYTSPDATTWTQRNGSGGITCAYGNGFWLILRSKDNMSCFKSTDGINYSAIDYTNMTFLDETGQTLTGNDIPTSMATFLTYKLKFWNGKFWLFMVWGINFDLYSTEDGITWQRKRLAAFTSTVTSSRALSNTTLARVQLSDDNGTLFIPYIATASANMTAGYSSCLGWSTTDGVTFTQIKDISNSSNAQGCSFLTRVNGLYLALGAYHNGVLAADHYSYSTDGLNWTQQSYGTTSQTLGGASCFVNGDMTYVNGMLYTFCGRATSNPLPIYYYTSSDGLNWTENQLKTFISGTGNPYFMFKNGVFIIVGSTSNGTDETADNTLPNGGFRVSVDGANWTIVNEISSSTTYTDVAAM